MPVDTLTSSVLDGTSSRPNVYRNFIDGEWAEASTGETFEDRNPADDRDVIGIFQRSAKPDVDAAIDRFQDATLAKPGYAIPFRFLGEAQEKKGLKRDAIKSYTRYLDLYPRAEDKDKIEKKIEKLRSEVAKSKKKSS